MECAMPTDTIIVLTGIAAGFLFFAGVVLFTDMTWNRDR